MRFGFNGTLMSNKYAKVMRWYGFTDNVCPADIRDLCEKADGEEIELEVNCDGGDLAVGSEIYSVLRDYKGTVRAHIQSRSASAATVAMMGADSITAEPVSLICVHNPTTYASGEQRDMQGAADSLGACKEIILEAYMGRAKVSREEISALMDRNVYITAKKAMEYGIVDSITEAAGETIIVNGDSEKIHFPTEKMIADFMAAKEAEKDKTEAIEKQRKIANAFLAKYR